MSKLTTLVAAGLFLSMVLAIPAHAQPACCTVTAVDTRSGVVTAQEVATKRKFEFKVDNAVVVNRIRAGMRVDADFKAGKASVEGIGGRFAIVGAAAQPAPAVAAPQPPPAPQQPTAAPKPAPPTVTAQAPQPMAPPKAPAAPQPPAPPQPAAAPRPALPTPTPATPQPSAPPTLAATQQPTTAPPLAAPGKASTGPVIGTAPRDPSASAPIAAPAREGYCCRVTAINPRAGTVTAEEESSRRSFTFKLDNPVLASRIAPGHKVAADFPASAATLEGIGGRFRIIDVQAPSVALAPPRAAGTPTRKTYPLPTITAGAPVPVSPRERTRAPGLAVGAHLRGLDEIETAAIPDAAKIVLMMHAGTLPENASDHYIVNPKLAAEWAKTHSVPSSMKPEKKKKKKKKKCDWTHSGGCADKIERTAQDVWDSATEKWREAWKHNTKELEKLWNEGPECFTDHVLRLPDIPIKFSVAPEFPISVERSAERQSTGTGERHGASGTAKGTVTFGLPVQADFRAEVQFFYIPCLPFAIRPRSVGADGNMTIAARLGATLTASGKFDSEYMIPPTGGPAIPVAVVPIVIAGVPVAVLDVAIYVDGSLRVGGEGQLDARFVLTTPYKTDFDFNCDGRGCRGNMKGTPMPTTATENVVVKGGVYVKPAVYTALQLSLNFEALAGRAGPQPYLLGELRGCSETAGMQSTTGASSMQEFHALAADLDWGVELRAEALVAGEQVRELVVPVMRERHIWFGDIAPGGSTAIAPDLSGPAQLAANASGAFVLKAHKCFPYKSAVEYRITWLGGATPSASASGHAGSQLSGVRAGAASEACTWGSGQGTCKVRPGAQAAFNLRWPQPGTYSLTAVPLRDEHGREFKADRATQLSVIVQ